MRAHDGTIDKLHWAEAVAAGTLPVTYLHLDVEPLTPVFSLWLLLSSQFLVHEIVCTESLYLSGLLARMLCGTVSKVYRSLGRYYCSCLIQQHSYPVVDGNQISLAQFSIGVAKLADSYHLPVYHMPWHSLQELFHDLAGLSMFLRTSILPFLRVSAMLLCFSVMGHFI